MKQAKRPQRPRDPPITLSETGGVRYLHFGSEWVQGAMRIRAPDRLELEYLQRMMAWLLFLAPPAEMLQIGVGAGALLRFCLRQLPATRITGVELSQRVLEVARSQFGLPSEDDRLRLVVGDGAAWMVRPQSTSRYGVIAIDAFDAAARGPVLGSPAFYRACRRALADAGILVVNLFGEHPSLARHRVWLQNAFDGRVLELAVPGQPNAIAFAFSGPPLTLEWSALRARAGVLSRCCGLPAREWVAALVARSPGTSTWVI